MAARKHSAATQQHQHWMEGAWPEAHEKFRDLYQTVQEKGVLDPKTKAFIGLAAASLLRCKHCVGGTVDRLKTDYNATDREIAEVMMTASLAAAGTNMAWAKEVFEEKLGSR